MSDFLDALVAAFLIVLIFVGVTAFCSIVHGCMRQDEVYKRDTKVKCFEMTNNEQCWDLKSQNKQGG